MHFGAAEYFMRYIPVSLRTPIVLVDIANMGWEEKECLVTTVNYSWAFRVNESYVSMYVGDIQPRTLHFMDCIHTCSFLRNVDDPLFFNRWTIQYLLVRKGCILFFIT